MSTPDSRWNDALLAAACVALDPVGTGGIVVRSAAGDVRDAWLARWRTFLSPKTPVRSIPIHVDDSRLFGGIDLSGSLATGRLVREKGLLEQVAGGCAILAMAERIERATAGRIVGAHDAAPFALVALDEGEGDAGESADGDHARIASSLAERIGLTIDLHDCPSRAIGDPAGDAFWQEAVDAARGRLKTTSVDDDLLVALCEAAASLGIDSARAPLFALSVTRAIAALHGRERADVSDAAAAARLVLAPRATRLPPVEAEAPPEPPSQTPEDATADGDDQESSEDATTSGRPLEDVVQEAAVAAIPAGLLARLAVGARSDRTRAHGAGGAGATIRDRLRGAPAGVRRGRPRAPERLALVETLRAAAPWQRVRRAERPQSATRVQVRADDLHTRKFRRRRASTTVFVVDASGSSALHRLAEAKGAVELLLADCYVRRDQVAVIAFRGQSAQVLLAPTRSLVRARRSLAELPGGGGTPLAHALDAARDLVVASRRRGETVLTVFLSDGRANVARDGSGGRARAEADAQEAARGFRAIGGDALFIDTAPRPHPEAAALADAMGAIYHPLPHATARDLSKVVQMVAGDGAR